MSQQADGLKASDMQNTEEKELGMQCHKPHEKTKSYAFLSSKSTPSSNNKTIHHQYSLIDDDLGTWLQYPFDDDVACHDMFQHWPSSSPSPALPSLHFPPSPILKGPLPQQNEGLMVDLASDEPLEICESLVSVKNDQKPITLLNHASCSEDSILQDALKQRVGEVRQLDPLIRHGNEVASPVLGAVNMQQVGGSEIRGVSKDFKKLSQSKLLSQEDASGWAVANEVPNAGTHNKHMDKRIVGGGEDWDNKSAHTARLRQPPRHAGLPHLNVAGSSSDHGLVNKDSVNSSYREDPSQMEKDVSRKLSATTTTAQAMMSAPACPAADAALALGAGRAAGVIKPLGVEAFSKVRTSLQPARPSKLGSPPLAWAPSPTSAGQYTSYPTGYPPSSRGTASGFHDYALSTQLFQQTLHNAAQPYFFRPCVNFSDVASQGHQSMHPQIGDIDSSSNSFCSVSSTMVLPGFRGKEEVSVGSEQVPCGEQAKFVDADGTVAATFGMDTPEMQRPSGFSLPYRDRKDDVVFSGGSETSESLKETFSGSKRKLDDSECQSEDAEGESTVNSQSRSSNMKRTRANEVHNLSERRRRNRINDKMNALRDLIPNATKSNKAALLDEAIDYLKNLQLQLQVMSMRTGVSLPPMVLPATLPHMQMPIHPVGIGMTGGSSLEMGFGGAGSTVGIAMCDMTYGLPAGSLTNLTSPNSMVLQPPANNAEPRVMRAHEVASSQFSHPFVHAPSQPPCPVNMDVYNNFLQHQQLQHHLPHQEQVAVLQAQPSSQQPSSSQEAQYGI